jgi:putative ABC transport system substrate-binding protein
MALLVNPDMHALAEPVTRSSLAAAHAMGIELQILHATSDADFDAAFQRATELRAGGLVIGPNVVFTGRIKQLVSLIIRRGIPAVYEFREFATLG